MEKFRLMTWLEIKPNKQVRLYAPSHDADKSGGLCCVFVFRLFAFGFVCVGCARCFFGSFFVFCVCSFLVVVLFFLRVRPFVLSFLCFVVSWVFFWLVSFGSFRRRVGSSCFRWLFVGVSLFPLLSFARSWFCSIVDYGRTLKLDLPILQI